LTMKRRTKELRFDIKTRETIAMRDSETCLFCSMYYQMPETIDSSNLTFDIMHFIPKSQGGLGIEQNGVYGCRYHHHLLDNGNKGLRSEMLGMMAEYLKGIYPDWNKENLIYKKTNY